MLMAMFDATPREVAFPTVETCGFAAFAAKPDELRAAGGGAGAPARRALRHERGPGVLLPPAPRCRPRATPARRRAFPLDPAGAVRVRDPGSGRLLAAGEAGEIEGRGAEPHARVLREPGRHPGDDDRGRVRPVGGSRIPHGRRRLRVPRADGGRHAARRIPGESGRDRGAPQRASGGARRASGGGGHRTRSAPPSPSSSSTRAAASTRRRSAAIAGGPSRASRCRRASSRWTSSRPRGARTGRRSAARSSAASRRSASPRPRPPLLRSPPAAKSRTSSTPMNSRSASADRSARAAAAAGPMTPKCGPDRR